MSIENPAKAESFLSHINYYRLSAYWRPFLLDAGTDNERFKQNTCFEVVQNLYTFDRELRLLMLDAIEHIEISIRTQWAYFVAHEPEHGAHAHLNAKLFIKNNKKQQAKRKQAEEKRERQQERKGCKSVSDAPDNRDKNSKKTYKDISWPDCLKQLQDEVDRSSEDFIKHYKETYKEELPPIWVVCEVMSLGSLSQWYRILESITLRQGMASVFDIDHRALGSWLQHLSVVRNICAHHGRLWDREFSILLSVPRGNSQELTNQFQRGSRKIYNTFLLTLHMLDVIIPGHSWRTRTKNLIAAHKIDVSKMGFPADWCDCLLWREEEKL